MCGIAGIVVHRGSAPTESLLERMADGMRTRGPDDRGFLVKPEVGLAHTRLSIRDLSPAGRCPMADSRGEVHVVFNGEIYNWRPLREALEGRGHTFVSRSDTEVLVRGFLEWGVELVPRLRGMFAIAFWSTKRRELVIARDRCGEKPLFFHEDDRALAFASTLNALSPALPQRDIDPVALGCFLAHSFIPSQHTIWKGVRVLPPAHLLVLRPGARAEVRRYWELPRVGPARMSMRDAEHLAEAAITKSVHECLDADVPVGIFLSGGVDSSLIAAFAAREGGSLETFSLGFREQAYSELPYAARVAQHLGLRHHVTEATVDDALRCLPELVAQYGQPFGDASAVPTHLVSRLARERVKVVLSGDGGDESFGGYWRLQSVVYAARYARVVPASIRRRVVPFVSSRLGSIGARWRALNTLSLGGDVAYTNSESWYDHLGDLAGPNLVPALEAPLASYRAGGAVDRPEASLVQRVLFDDFRVQLPDAYLTKVDVASMAASLEVRAPLLDSNVVETAWRLPDSAKLRWGSRKWLLKRIAARRLPREVVYRPKMGFGLPLPTWFRTSLGDVVQHLFADSRAGAHGWIRPEVVLHTLTQHRAGRNHATRLWLALWLELWFRIVVDCTPPTEVTLGKKE